MKIRLTESKLKQIVEESVKNVLLEYSPKVYTQAADEYSRKHSREAFNNEPDTLDKMRALTNKRVALNQHATNLYNKQGGGSCITNSSSYQLNYKSAMGYDCYITADGMVGIVGKGRKYRFTEVPNELKVKPNDAKSIATWCNDFIRDDYPKQTLANEKFWIVK